MAVRLVECQSRFSSPMGKLQSLCTELRRFRQILDANPSRRSLHHKRQLTVNTLHDRSAALVVEITMLHTAKACRGLQEATGTRIRLVTCGARVPFPALVAQVSGVPARW